MFEDIHKIDSAVFKPDPTKAKSDRERRFARKRAASEKDPKPFPGIETDEMQPEGVDEENKEHPFLDIRV